MDPHNKDPLRRRVGRRYPEVESWKTKRATELCAVNDSSIQVPGGAEQSGRARQIAIRQKTADCRARHPCSGWIGDCVKTFDRVTEFGAECFEQRVITAASGPKAKVVADEKMAGTHLPNQHRFDEIMRRQGG